MKNFESIDMRHDFFYSDGLAGEQPQPRGGGVQHVADPRHQLQHTLCQDGVLQFFNMGVKL